MRLTQISHQRLPQRARMAPMQDRYDPKAIEPRGQDHWAKKDLVRAGTRPGAQKKYVRAMLPYPSGEMHMGHARVYSITDVLARYARKRGFDVFHPFGWDAFGLPAENAAIKEGVHPAERTPRNIASFKQDVIALGISVDWSTEISTSDPEYYHWNQWFFLRMLERGIAYRRRAKVNFCPHDNTVLANEQVEEGRCWRCGTVVVEREIPEWALRITAYADQLLEGLNRIDWPERVVAMQRNWIGRSDGLEIDFAVKGARGKSFRVFTTRADTIFGATYVAAAPDHPLVAELAPAAKKGELQAFAEKVRRASKELGEGAQAAEKDGLDTGIRAKNPFTGKEIPVWVANFVLSGYGTGAVMAVPAHDQRDYEFATKFGLSIVPVVRPADDSELPKDKAYVDYGYLFGSGEFSGMPSQQARLAIAAEAQRRGIGKPAVNYHLRDWGISRQRYWGTPIPIIYCDKCDPEHEGIPVPDEDLPVVLPDIDVKEVLTGKGEPPLAKVASWVNIECPRCAAPAEKDMDWSDEQVEGQHRFLGRVWRLVHGALPRVASAKAGGPPDDLRRRTHKTILRVTQQLERLQFNTAISSLMELSNAATDWQGDPSSLRESLEVLVQLLAPFAPHIANELWPELGRSEELSTLHWPEADPSLVVDDAYQIAVQVNGKLRGEVQVAATAGEAEIRDTAARDPKVAGWLHGKTIKKVVVIPKRLVNFVVAG